MNLFAQHFAKTFSRILNQLPRSWQVSLGRLIGFLWFDVFRIRRNVALENLRLAFPELSEQQRVQIARESLYNIGITFVEILMMVAIRPEQIEKYFVLEGRENFDGALSEQRGVLLLSMHLGNGDFGCMALSRMGFPIHLISKQFKSKALNDFWFGIRRSHGTQFIREEKSSYDILKVLRGQEAVIFVLDQFMGPPVGVRTRFFGKETGTAAGLALFAERTKAPVLPIYTYRRPDGRLQIVCEPPVVFESVGDRSQNISHMTQKYTEKIEKIVRHYPGQWMWIHRRWKAFREDGS